MGLYYVLVTVGGINNSVVDKTKLKPSLSLHSSKKTNQKFVSVLIRKHEVCVCTQCEKVVEGHGGKLVKALHIFSGDYTPTIGLGNEDSA